MERIRFFEHEGTSVLKVDYSNLKAEEVLKVLVAVRAVLRKEPPGSVRCLVDVSDMHFNAEVLRGFNSLVANEGNTHIKAMAIVGISGLQKIAYSTIMKFSKIEMPLFDTGDQALYWLISRSDGLWRYH